MDFELKKKWVDGLRSGEYTQTYYSLNRRVSQENCPAGHCALGVLCAIADIDFSYYQISNLIDQPGTCFTSNLIDLNDEEKKSFNEIADWIEERI